MKTLAIMMGNVIGVSLVMSRCWVVPKDSTVSTPPPIGRRRAEYIKMIFGKESSIYIEEFPTSYFDGLPFVWSAGCIQIGLVATSGGMISICTLIIPL